MLRVEQYYLHLAIKINDNDSQHTRYLFERNFFPLIRSLIFIYIIKNL